MFWADLSCLLGNNALADGMATFKGSSGGERSGSLVSGYCCVDLFDISYAG
jgi:hypothetical protein